MQFKTISGCGKIADIKIQSTNLSVGKNKTLEFFKDTFMQFARVSKSIFEITGDMPFCYKEKQLSSIFLPAFYELGYGAIQEIPTRRKPSGQDDSHAWLDYWVQKGDIVYLIEVKHGDQYFNGEKMSAGNENKWMKSIEQLKTIRKKHENFLSNGMTVIKIALMVMPIWKNDTEVEIGDVLYTKPEDLFDLLSNLRKNMTDKNMPDWAGIWSLPKSMQCVYESELSIKNRVVPGLIMFAKVIS